jgi:hypothetical protein
MANRRRIRFGKFFRRLISSSRPQDIGKVIERYERELESIEDNYMELILSSGGALNYQALMTMPVPALQRMIKKYNEKQEAIKQNLEKSRR